MSTYDSKLNFTSPWVEMWQNSEADATVLTAMLLHKYGEQSLDWDPLTIRLEVQADYYTAPSDENMNKICAMQIVMTSADFFNRIDAFLNVCNTLASGDPFFEVFTPLESEEIAYALATVAMNRNMLPFNPTIRQYVREVLKADGFTEKNFPEIFSVVFDRTPSSKEVRDIVSTTLKEPTAAEQNSNNIKVMLADNVTVMLNQFNKLPGLTHIDDSVLEQGLLLSLGKSSG